MNWIELLAATVSASLIGSIHCVGMCGPFAIMATHRQSEASENSYAKIASYHLGRLTTYFMLGTFAGVAGTLLNGAGYSIGISHSAARIVGATMVILGIVRLISMIQVRSKVVSHSALLQRWTHSILAIGRRMQPESPVQRAYVIGLITTWLPCGWLYLFAIAASSIGSVVGANALMFAFWIGTLPLLSILSIGSDSIRNQFTAKAFAAWPFAPRSKRGGSKLPATFVERTATWKLSSQGVTASLMIAFGCYTFFHRSQIQLDSLAAAYRPGVLTKASIQSLPDHTLPCCSQSSNAAEVDEGTQGP